MTNETHPVALAAQEALRDAGTAIEQDRCMSLIRALDDATDSRLVRIVAERALDRSGFDVLFAMDPDPAGLFVAADALDLAQLYGPNHDAIVGIMRAAVETDAAHIKAVGYQVGQSDARYAFSFELAESYGAARMLADACSDVHFACMKPEVTSAAAMQAHLRGVRGFELATMYYVLVGAGAARVDAQAWRPWLTPLQRVFFPSWPRV